MQPRAIPLSDEDAVLGRLRERTPTRRVGPMIEVEQAERTASDVESADLR